MSTPAPVPGQHTVHTIHVQPPGPRRRTNTERVRPGAPLRASGQEVTGRPVTRRRVTVVASRVTASVSGRVELGHKGMLSQAVKTAEPDRRGPVICRRQRGASAAARSARPAVTCD